MSINWWIFKAHPDYLTGGEGNPGNIFKRLATIANKNLVAVSEAGMYDVTPYNRLIIDNLEGGIDKNITDWLKFYKEDTDSNNISFNDTTFICGAFDKNHTEDNSTTDSSFKIMNANGLIILNCHLDSKGPNVYNEKIGPNNKWTENVKDFLFSKLPVYSLKKSIDVIVGDTNITVSKSNNGSIPIDRKKLLETIIEGITIRYPPQISEPEGIHKTWVLITSSAKINKPRSGFLLINNQMYKSNNPETVEEDGTIIAIRAHNNDRLETLLNREYCNNNFGKNWCISYKNKDPSKGYIHISSINTESSTQLPPINFLQFTNMTQCINSANMPNDVIFIDHSVVAVSKNALLNLTNKYHVKKNELTNYQWNNLVALNLGSIINSENPWNLKLFQDGALSKIQIADKWLFSKLFLY